MQVLVKCLGIQNNALCTIPVTVEGVPGPWTDWICVDTCGETVEYRNRTCLPPDDLEPNCPYTCDFDLFQEVPCFAGCCECKCILFVLGCYAVSNPLDTFKLVWQRQDRYFVQCSKLVLGLSSFSRTQIGTKPKYPL